MADVEIVIKIPEEKYNMIKSLFSDKIDEFKTEEDVFEIRRYTFARSIILDEVFLLNGREPIPTIHPDHPPRYVD